MSYSYKGPAVTRYYTQKTSDSELQKIYFYTCDEAVYVGGVNGTTTLQTKLSAIDSELSTTLKKSGGTLDSGSTINFNNGVITNLTSINGVNVSDIVTGEAVKGYGYITSVYIDLGKLNHKFFDIEDNGLGTGKAAKISKNDLNTALGLSAFSGKSIASSFAVGTTDHDHVPTTQAVSTLVNNAIGNINQFKYNVVDTLPTASADTMYTIYLVADTHSDSSDSYDEYITIRSGTSGSYTYSWEKIGNTDVNLSEYVKTVTVSGDSSGVITSATKSGDSLTLYRTSLAQTATTSTGLINSIDVTSDGKITVSEKAVPESFTNNQTIKVGTTTIFGQNDAINLSSLNDNLIITGNTATKSITFSLANTLTLNGIKFRKATGSVVTTAYDSTINYVTEDLATLTGNLSSTIPTAGAVKNYVTNGVAKDLSTLKGNLSAAATDTGYYSAVQVNASGIVKDKKHFLVTASSLSDTSLDSLCTNGFAIVG